MNGPALLPTDDKGGPEIQHDVGLDVTGGGAGLRDYIAGSAGQSPEASDQGILAGGDDPEVAILVECGAVREVRSQQYWLSKEQALVSSALARVCWPTFQDFLRLSRGSGHYFTTSHREKPE